MPGLLYAGTDDGNVWMTHNGGAQWDNLTGRFPGLPDNEVYVSRIEPSHTDSMTFWVSFDNHARGDFRPYLYVTHDDGRTFASIVQQPSGGRRGRLRQRRPAGSVQSGPALRRDLDQRVRSRSTPAGRGTASRPDLPSVPVFDLKIQPRDRDLIAATHGRGFWIVNIAPLEQLDTTVLAGPAFLFAPVSAYQWGEAPTLMEPGNGNAQAFFSVPNPPYGADDRLLARRQRRARAGARRGDERRW